MTTKPKPQAVSAKKISDQFVAAFDGGGAIYWCHWAKLLRSDNKSTVAPWYACSSVFERSFEAELTFDLEYEDDCRERKVITQDGVRRALDVMARRYPKQFADVINETRDAHTGDALIQCAVYGNIRYDFWLDGHVPLWKRGLSQEALDRHER
jgi:hypothetical protein